MYDQLASEAVYLATVDESFKPQRPWNLPEGSFNVTLHSKNLTLDQAAGFVYAHNKSRLQQFQRGEPIGTWAIMARAPKPFQVEREMRRVRKLQEGQAKGGAA